MRTPAPIAAVMLLLAVAPRPALAQPHEDLEALHRRGLALREAGRAAEALAVFQQAHAMSPEPRSLVRMALAEAELGRWVDADTHLTQALEARGDRFVRAHLRDLEAELASVHGHIGWLEVQSNTPGLAVSLNGADPVAVTHTPMRVVEGALNIELRAPSCRSIRRALTVAPGATEHVILELDCAPTPAAPTPGATTPDAPPAVTPTPVAVTPSRPVERPAAPVRPPRAASPGPWRTVAWVSAGGAVALLGIGVAALVVGGDAASQWNDDSRCLVGASSRGETCADQQSTLDTMRPLAIGGLVAGSLAAATSVVMFVVSARAPASTATGWACAPWLHAAGASCGARF